jgi:hypothetical protein
VSTVSLPARVSICRTYCESRLTREREPAQYKVGVVSAGHRNDEGPEWPHSVINEEVMDGSEPRSAEVRARFFTARASGATLREAAAAAGISRTAGHYWLARSGGVRPRTRRPRPALRLSLEEREAISRGLAQRKTLTAIAEQLGRPYRRCRGSCGATAAPTVTVRHVPTGWP